MISKESLYKECRILSNKNEFLKHWSRYWCNDKFDTNLFWKDVSKILESIAADGAARVEVQINYDVYEDSIMLHFGSDVLPIKLDTPMPSGDVIFNTKLILNQWCPGKYWEWEIPNHCPDMFKQCARIYTMVNNDSRMSRTQLKSRLANMIKEVADFGNTKVTLELSNAHDFYLKYYHGANNTRVYCIRLTGEEWLYDYIHQHVFEFDDEKNHAWDWSKKTSDI